MSTTTESKPESYRHVVACKKCGVCDDQHIDGGRERSEEPIPLEEKPGYHHYERTGHTCIEINYTIAPYDVQMMLDDGRLDALDFERLAEVATGEAEA